LDYRQGIHFSVFAQSNAFPIPHRAFAVSPDARTFAIGANNGIKLIDIASGQTRREFVANSPVSAIAFSPDGQQLASGHVNTCGYLWNVAGSWKTERLAISNINRDYLAAITTAEFHDLIPLFLHESALVIELAKTIPVDNGRLLKSIENWLEQLDHPRYSVRVESEEKLSRLSGDYLETIEKYLDEKTRSDESRARGNRVQNRIIENAAAFQDCTIPRVIELLERIGSEDARVQLKRLAAGSPGISQTIDAATTLERLNRRSKK
jgi:hypothetical protein